jgi:endonuclease YncB( thermonuclease family)
VTNRKPKTRRRSAKKSGGAGVWSWVLMLAVVAGGIQAYEHRDSFMPKRQTAKASPSAATPSRDVAVAKPKAASSTASLTTPGVPVPPRPIMMPAGAASSQIAAATLPSQRPDVQKVSLGEKSGAFAFCGRSGLNNCVADGNTFWMKGVKMKLAGIEVPQTDQARCMNERQKGFAAKVRLRDMLNGGAFEVASAGNGSGEQKSLSRSGMSFAEQLMREGLAHPATAKNQSWCG